MTQLNLLDREWVNRHKPIVLDLMNGAKQFSANDLHGWIDEPENPNLWGILFSQLRPYLEKVGYQPSARPSRNGGVEAVWRVKQ